ncbi:MAG: metal-dependent transcriptional regulator [Bacillota bacterium]
MTETDLTANMEDYLKTIGILAGKSRTVRVKEIAWARGVRPASVHAALHLLAKKGLVEHEHYGGVKLTAAGALLAKKITARHEILAGFLRDILGVPAETAEEDACRMEHAMSECSLRRLESFLKTFHSAGKKEESIEEAACHEEDPSVDDDAPGPDRNRP